MDDQATVNEEGQWDDGRDAEPLPIGNVLAELLAQYQTRFPKINITIAQTPVAA
jgi:hypothetical protein